MVRAATKKAGKNHGSRRREKTAMQRKGERPLDQVKTAVARGQPIANIEDMPAGGKFSCGKCDLYFRDEHTLSVHNRTKAHKRRARDWGNRCHDAKDAERAAGLL